MNFRNKFLEFSYINTDWRRVLTRGVLMLFLGVMLVIFTLFKPDVMIFHARDTSWLPVCGFIILVLGFLECFDAMIAKEAKDFFLNLQNGLLDVVVALLIIFSSGDEAIRLNLLITAFLIIKGSFRIIMTYAIQRPNTTVTRIGAIVSIVLGILIWMQFPTSAGWFLAFCLSTEIALRGWAIIMLALWLQSRQEPI
jgi:uncharacterized membrane protein HdeD (DUF308 family)